MTVIALALALALAFVAYTAGHQEGKKEGWRLAQQATLAVKVTPRPAPGSPVVVKVTPKVAPEVEQMRSCNECIAVEFGASHECVEHNRRPWYDNGAC